MTIENQQELRFNDFLAAQPAGATATILGLAKETHGYAGTASYHIDAPDLLLHCEEITCAGLRYFRCDESESGLYISKGTASYPRLQYTCANCEIRTKVFVLQVHMMSPTTGDCVVHKMGEVPPYGPPVPAKLISLVGSERENFLKGRRCENQNLGVGAFAYYRRVVEAQRSKIFAAIIDAAEKLKMEAESIDILRAAARETQFSKSLEMAKDVMPTRLLMQGHSPLKLLHAALSHGVHNMTDEECLEHASSVRVVLAAMAEALDQVKKNQTELTAAISVLLKVRE
ncbi:hypothetical protein [Achromobacter kerstersii]